MTGKKRVNFVAVLLLILAVVITSVILSLGYRNVLNANAYTSGKTPDSIGSLTFDGYETTVDKAIFDAGVLDELYGAITGNTIDTYDNAYTKVQGSTSTITSWANGSKTYPDTQNYSMNFSMINGGKAITLEFGGYTWNVVYLTTNTTSSTNGNGDLIATLWMSEVDEEVGKVPYAAYSSTSSGSYISSNFSTSKMLIDTLNGGNTGSVATQWAIGVNTLSTVTSTRIADRVANPYAKFTMTNDALKGTAKEGESLVEYLVAPNQVRYQEKENWVWAYKDTGAPYLSPNEAWGSPDTTIKNYDGSNQGGGWMSSTISQADSNKNWANSLLWLPSLTETGVQGHATSLWGIPDVADIRASANALWMRTAKHYSGTASWTTMKYLYATGQSYGEVGVTSNTLSIRPALHINLTKAEANSGYKVPDKISAVYNGAVQTLTTLKSELDWYVAAYDVASAFKVEYLSTAGNVLTGNALPTSVGQYQIRFTIQDRTNFEWWDADTDTSSSRVMDFEITQKPLTVDFDVSVSPATATVKDGLCLVDSAIKDTILRIHYTGTSGTTSYDKYEEPSNVGNYTAAVEIDPSVEGSSNYKLDKTYREDIIISTKQLTLPKVETDYGVEKWATYDSTEQYYTIDYDRNLMEITVADGFEDKFDWDGEYISVTNAGEYKDALKVSLKNAYDAISGTGRYVWDANNNDVTDKYISFTLEKKELKLDFRTDSSDGKINAPIGSSCTVSVVLNDGHTNYKPDGSDVVHIAITASRDGTATPVTVYSDLAIRKTSDNSVSITLNISGLKMQGSYVVKLVSDDSNYDVSLVRDITLVLTKSAQSADLVWWLMENGNDTDYSKNAAVGVFDVDFDVTDLVYNGKAYSFYVTAPFGYEIYEDIKTVKKGTTNVLNGVKDAGEYVSTVKIVKEGDDASNVATYTLNWAISKALMDLTNVKWLNDGKMEYNDGALVLAAIDSDTLPEGLLVNSYGGTKDGYDVGPCGNVSVTFKLADGYEVNYELPASGGKDTNYTFTGDGDFEWTKTWEIVPAVFELKWVEKQITDGDGNIFFVLVLEDARADGKVEYAYYLTDVMGNILDESPLSEDEIVYSATNRKYYKTYPSIRSGYDKNYIFPENVSEDNRYSDVFSVGGGSASVTVSLSTDKYEYNNGKPVSLKIDIVGAATMNNLTLTYYKGDIVDDANKLDGAPINVGKYLVVIKSNTPTVVLSGITQYEFEITQNIVSTEWKMGAKPPVLDLKYGQINGVEYEIYDSLGNLITDISDIVPGDYKIRAKISDTQNYIFDDDTYETEFVDFTIREGDEIYDPNDSSNPFYPQEDPDNPNPGGDDNGGGSVLDKIKEFFDKLIESHFPLWQVITMAVSALLALIFMIKAIQYGNRAKKAKGEAKKLSARTYASLLPVFSSEVVALGLTNKIWSIMAFAFVGLALLMFIIALITRHSWKKAELAKENAIDEYKLGGGNANNQAHSSEFKEIKEQLALMSSQQSAGANADGGSLAIIEAMRREMLEREERYRRDEEERRRNDEERHREEMAALREEQNRRDEAMKLMLAGMMGRPQGDEGFAYASLDDTDMLVQRVIAGLLPAVQQMMPEATAYLAAPSEENEELKALVEEQSEEIRNMAEAHSEEMRAMSDQISELQEQLAAALSQERADAVILPDSSDEINALTAQITALQEQLTDLGNQTVTVAADPNANSEVLAKMNEMQQQIAALSAGNTTTVYVEREADEDTDSDDDEEEWDSVLDEDDDDFIEAVVIDDDGTVRKASPNFRMRLKQSSDKNREWYAAIKNLFCSQKNITYRVYKRVEKIRYQGNVIAVIGIAKRSIKLWLALKPFEYDARRYHHKDVSDKPRFVDVPLYIRVGSDRALTRAQELILALFQEQATEPRKRYTDRDIQELIFTLKYNKLLTKQNKGLLREVMHVHDCDVLDNEIAEKCIESKNVESIDDSVIETVKLDDIDMHFQDGNRVTVEKLRKLGLVSANCTGYNVTAGQRLTKPLIIVANDFTMEAVKMIALTGGRVVKLTKVSK